MSVYMGMRMYVGDCVCVCGCMIVYVSAYVYDMIAVELLGIAASMNRMSVICVL